jgi:hypothetical protein
MNDPMQQAPAGGSRSLKRSHGDSAPNDTAPSLLDELANAEDRATEGMARALHGEDVRMVAVLEAEVRRFAATGEPFLPDEIMPELASRRALGPIFKRLADAGEIEFVGYATSTRPERHGAPTRLWQGTGGGAS